MPIMLLLFTVIPALELYLLIKIGGQIGGWNTVMIIVVTGILGATLAKSQGLQILNKIQQEVNRGGLPGNQIIQGLMVFAGGLLLLTPGFVTDIVGFALVLPGTRHLLMTFVRSMVMRALKNGNIQFQSFGGGQFYQYRSGDFRQENNFEQQKKHMNQEISPGVFEAEYEEKKDS